LPKAAIDFTQKADIGAIGRSRPFAATGDLGKAVTEFTLRAEHRSIGWPKPTRDAGGTG